MTEEDYKYRQGRSKQKVVDSELMAMVSVVGLIVVIIGVAIYNMWS